MSGGDVLIKRIFDVSELSTKNLSLLKHECVKIKCNDFSLYVSAIYLAPDVEKRAYKDSWMKLRDNSGLRDVILIIGDFKLPKVKWKVVWRAVR
jgi:hypothetical protein